MTTAFPAICPSKRRFTPGQYPVKRFNSLSGASVTRLYGNKPFDATMQMEFLLSDLQAENMLRSWHDSRGGFLVLDIPPEVFDGTSVGLKEQIPDSLNWRYAEEPTVESLFPGRVRLQVNLIGTLDS